MPRTSCHVWTLVTKIWMHPRFLLRPVHFHHFEHGRGKGAWPPVPPIVRKGVFGAHQWEIESARDRGLTAPWRQRGTQQHGRVKTFPSTLPVTQPPNFSSCLLCNWPNGNVLSPALPEFTSIFNWFGSFVLNKSAITITTTIFWRFFFH